MSNTLQRIGTGFVAAAAPLIMNAGQVGAKPIIESSPTNPNDTVTTLVVPVPAASLPSSFPSPTNPNPPTKGDQARKSVMPLFVAQVAPQDKQPPSNRKEKPNSQPPTPSGGSSAATFMQGRIEEVRRGQEDLTQTLDNLPPVPGG